MCKTGQDDRAGHVLSFSVRGFVLDTRWPAKHITGALQRTFFRASISESSTKTNLLQRKAHQQNGGPFFMPNGATKKYDSTRRSSE